MAKYARSYVKGCQQKTTCAGNKCRKGTSPEKDVAKISVFSELCGRLMLFVSLALSLVVAYEGVYFDIVGHTSKVLT